MDGYKIIILAMILQVNAQVTTRFQSTLFCQQKIDLAFVIDSSSSIPKDDFHLQIEFIKDIVRFLNVVSDQTRVAAVSFSNYVFPEFNFKTFSRKDEILQALSNIHHSMGDATRTYLALQHTNENIFAPGNGERPDAIDVVVVLTDGATNPGSYDRHWSQSAKNETQIQAALIKMRPAFIFSIGVGSEVDVNELNGMSSDPNERFTILVPSFKELNTDFIKEMLLDKSCIDSANLVSPTPTMDYTTTSLEVSTSDPCTKRNGADIFFLVDESSSLRTVENFQKELNFVNSVIDEYDVGRSQIRVGIMTFSTNPRMLIRLNDFLSKAEITSLLARIRWVGGDTYLDKALQLVMKEGLSPAFGGRTNVPQIIVVITDGQSTDQMKTEEAVKQLRSLQYIVYAIGVGPDRDPAELRKIASDPSHVFEVENVDGLSALKKEFVSKLCPGDEGVTVINIIQPNCTGAKADIIFIADCSSSIGYTAFDQLKSFAKSVVRRLTNGTRDIQVGLIAFSDNAQFQFRLNTYPSAAEINKAIDKMPYLTGNTNTHKALELLNKYGFSETYGGRDGVPKIAIVITDGASREPVQTRKLAEKAHNQGIILFSIGVGPYIDNVELAAMATSPSSKYTFLVNSYDALPSIEKMLVDKTCTVSKEETTTPSLS